MGIPEQNKGYSGHIPPTAPHEEVELFVETGSADSVYLPPAADRAQLLQAEYEHACRLSQEHGWDSVDPKLFFDSAIMIMPKTLRRYRPDEKALMPAGNPLSPLELYLLSHVPRNALPDHDEEMAGAFTALASIRICLGDEVRSRLFLESVGEAIRQLTTTGEETIEVVDAGCGALGLLGMYAAVCSPNVHATLLELNPTSARMARGVAESLGLSDRIEVLEADATQYTPRQPVDLLISETMNTALTAEPLVQVFSNLQPHMTPQGISLPVGVTVMAAAVSTKARKDPEAYVKSYGHAQKVVRANWQPIAEYKPGDQLNTIEVSFRGEELPAEGAFIGLASEVHLLGGRVLNLYDSAITTPAYITREIQEKAWEFNGSNIKRLTIAYRPGQELHSLHPSFALKY